MHQLNIFTAFAAGLVSFISPCVLPLVPSYLSFLTGTSLEDLKTDSTAQAKSRVIAHALAFISGFTVVFIAIGLSASAIGGVFENNKRIVEILGGIVIVVLGLQMLGVLKIPALMMDKRVHLVPRKQSYWVSFLVGLEFAAGWSPCIGPILSAIILLASQEKLPQATFLLFCYSMGLAIPFSSPRLQSRSRSVRSTRSSATCRRSKRPRGRSSSRRASSSRPTSSHVSRASSTNTSSRRRSK